MNSTGMPCNSKRLVSPHKTQHSCSTLAETHGCLHDIVTACSPSQ